MTGVIDDLLVIMRIDPDPWGAVATATTCAGRQESGHAFLGKNNFHLWYLRNRSLDDLYETAMHEIGHVLGIGNWIYSYSTWRHLFRPGDGDGHFVGPLAVAAFDAAGGEDYTGGKVPLEDRIPTLNIHWRRSVIPGDVMSIGRDSKLLTAITLGALADLGYEVDLGKADPYTLPMAAQGDAAALPDAQEAGEPDAELLADDVIRAPVVVVDRDGKVVRIIRP